MKKKVITGILAVLLLGAVAYVCLTLRINLNFGSEGELIQNGGMFTISFEGSDQYTDEPSMISAPTAVARPAFSA